MKTAAYSPLTWASDIFVEAWDDRLFVAGKLPLRDSDVQPDRDAYLGYISSVQWKFGEKRTGGKSPHIRFAKCGIAPEKLIGFVREFGPVAAAAVEIVDPAYEDDCADLRSTIAAFQNLDTLRREQSIYIAAFKLMGELRKGRRDAAITAIRQHVAEIVDGVRYWPDQWEMERKWRASRYYGGTVMVL